jgi:hypothetical protein
VLLDFDHVAVRRLYSRESLLQPQCGFRYRTFVVTQALVISIHQRHSSLKNGAKEKPASGNSLAGLSEIRLMGKTPGLCLQTSCGEHGARIQTPALFANSRIRKIQNFPLVSTDF